MYNREIHENIADTMINNNGTKWKNQHPAVTIFYVIYPDSVHKKVPVS